MIVILGTGQAAQHIADPLRERGIPYLFLSRKDWADREELIGLIKDANPKAVINCAAQRELADAQEELEVFGRHSREHGRG